jgi:hypothetical protein
MSKHNCSICKDITYGWVCEHCDCGILDLCEDCHNEKKHDIVPIGSVVICGKRPVGLNNIDNDPGDPDNFSSQDYYSWEKPLNWLVLWINERKNIEQGFYR